MKEISIAYYDKRNFIKYEDSVDDVKEMYFCNTFEAVVNNKRTPHIIDWVSKTIEKTKTKKASLIFYSDDRRVICAIRICKKLFGFKVVFIDGKDIEPDEGFDEPGEDFE